MANVLLTSTWWAVCGPAPLYGLFQEPQPPVSPSSRSNIILVVSNNDILNHFSRATTLLTNRSHCQGIFMDNYLGTFFLPLNFFPLEHCESWKWTNGETPLFTCDPQDGRRLLVTLVVGVTCFTIQRVASIKLPYCPGLSFFREKLWRIKVKRLSP